MGEASGRRREHLDERGEGGHDEEAEDVHAGPGAVAGPVGEEHLHPVAQVEGCVHGRHVHARHRHRHATGWWRRHWHRHGHLSIYLYKYSLALISWWFQPAPVEWL